MTRSFDSTLELTKMALSIIGIQTDSNQSLSVTRKFLNYIYYFNLVWLYTDVVSEFHWLVEGIRIGKDFEELTYIAPCITVTLLGTAKTAQMFLNVHLVRELIEKFRQIYPDLYEGNQKNTSTYQESIEVTEDDLKTKEAKIVHDSMKYLDLIIKFLFCTSCVVVTAFSCQPIVFMTIEYVTKGEVEIKYPLLCKYFFDTSSWGMAVCMYLHQVWSTILAALSVFGPDTLLYACCTFVQMHFRTLKLRLEGISGEGDTRAGFIELVERHQLLIDIVLKMEFLYAKSTLFNFIASSFLICLSAFNVTSIKEPGPVFSFATFLFMSLSQISMLCYCGDMIMKTSIEISDAAYNSRWYNIDQSLKKSIHIMIIRAQKPCKMTASNFADLNLCAFTTVLSRSWSYFALLKTIYN